MRLRNAVKLPPLHPAHSRGPSIWSALGTTYLLLSTLSMNVAHEPNSPRAPRALLEEIRSRGFPVCVSFRYCKASLSALEPDAVKYQSSSLTGFTGGGWVSGPCCVQ